jgi:hypothetical protein
MAEIRFVVCKECRDRGCICTAFAEMVMKVAPFHGPQGKHECGCYIVTKNALKIQSESKSREK